jgi:hypothetical protein
VATKTSTRAFCLTIGWLPIAFASTAHATEQQMVVNEVLLSAGNDPAAKLMELGDLGDETFDAPAYFVDVFDADAVLVGRVDAPGIPGGGGPRFYVLSTAAADAKLGMTGDAPDDRAAGGRPGLLHRHCRAQDSLHRVGCVNTRAPAAARRIAAGGMSLQRAVGAALTVAAPAARGKRRWRHGRPCPVAPALMAPADRGWQQVLPGSRVAGQQCWHCWCSQS